MALGTLAGSNLYFAYRSSYNSIMYPRHVREYFCPSCADPVRGPTVEL
jgi:hypothetical protein